MSVKAIKSKKFVDKLERKSNNYKKVAKIKEYDKQGKHRKYYDSWDD